MISDDRKKQMRSAGHTAMTYGAFSALVLGLLLLYCFAFANLVDPEIHGLRRFWLVFSNMLELPFPGVMTVPTGLGFVAASLYFFQGVCMTVKSMLIASEVDSERH